MDTEKRLQELDIKIELAHQAISNKEKTDPNTGWNDYCAYMQPEWDALAKLDREMRMLMTPEFEDLPDYGDVMSLNDFIESVKDGGFIDYDGSGTYVRDGKISNISIHPSDVDNNSVRKDFDTIIWFNK